MADRFYCPDPPTSGRITLRGDEARHLVRVRRVGVGESVEIFDGAGTVHRSIVGRIDKNQVDLDILESTYFDRCSPIQSTLAIAAPKGDRLDWLVEKATEIGVSRLVLMTTERSIVDPGEAKIKRLERTIVEASKQCGRNRLMRLTSGDRWTDLIETTSRSETRLAAHPGGIAPPHWPKVARGEPVTIAVGPEGGFTHDEIERAAAAGWIVVSTGESILRIETAGIVASSMILSHVDINKGET